MRNSIIWILLLILFAFTGCAGRKQPAVSPLPSASIQYPEAAEGEELMTSVESREEAEEIAALYGIELVSCSEHVATFHTEEDLHSVIRRGKENGWPPLEINYVITLDDPVVSMPARGSKPK